VREKPDTAALPTARPGLGNRTCGFRFSARDALVLAAGALLTLWLWRIPGGAGFFPLFTVLHFFLFCNIFRIRRQMELMWTGWFVLMAFVGSITTGSFWIAYTAALPVTADVIAVGLTRPWYHGVWARQINARHIDRYLAGENFKL